MIAEMSNPPWPNFDPNSEADCDELAGYVTEYLSDLSDAIANEAKRLGLSCDGWDYFDFTWDRFFMFNKTGDAAAFLELVDEDLQVDSYEEGDYSVDIPRNRLEETLRRLKAMPTP